MNKYTDIKYYELPNEEGKRTLIEIEKIKSTPLKYPRGNGKERKKRREWGIKNEKKEYEIFKNFIKNTCKCVRFFDTICVATELRQAEAALSASKADATVVVGDRGSSNTNNLYVICSSVCPKTLFVESAGEIDIETLDGAENVFVTAGASTPDKIIQEVCKKMTEKIENIAATTLAAAVVLSPTYIAIQFVLYFINLISLL